MVTQSPAIQIRPLQDIHELKAVEELQLEVWESSEREVLPSLAIIPLLDIGGVLLGAFAGPDLIGFVLGFPGFESDERILHSDMLAVKKSYRSFGLGYQLKLAQREAALAKGLKLITWTFDPLQATNAHLNFGKLGVIASRYKVNYYGETTSSLHSTGTDRLWVNWQLNSDRVKARVQKTNTATSKSQGQALVSCGTDDEPHLSSYTLDQPVVTIEIPRDINAIVQRDAALANRWREVTRSAFTNAIAANYLVADFVRAAGENSGGAYVLES